MLALTSGVAEQALEIDEENSKAIFRRGLSYQGVLQDMLDREDDGEFWDPDRAACVAEQARCVREGVAVCASVGVSACVRERGVDVVLRVPLLMLAWWQG